MAAFKIVFLDDDPVIRIVRLVLQNAERDPWVADFFAPEDVDLAPLCDAARGLRSSDGVAVELASTARPASEAHIVIFRRGTVTQDTLDANPQLRLIQRLGERPEGIDLEAAAARGVPVSCLPRRTLGNTAEHAMLLMLALAKRLLPADQAVRSGRYDAARVHPIEGVAYNWPGMTQVGGLNGKTLGLIGLGELGTLVAKLAKAFGMRVLYTKRHRASAADEGALGVEYAALPELLALSDFVSLHAANLPENDGMIDAQVLAAMGQGAFFINTSRGRLVEEDALFSALVDGRIAGAGLDVHRIEPRPAGDRFSALPNVVMTPHIAGGARSGLLDEFRVIIGNCQAVLRGDAPRYRIDAAAERDSSP